MQPGDIVKADCGGYYREYDSNYADVRRGMQTATTATRAPAGKGVIAGTVVLGSFVSVMDISIVNVAMPQIGRQMHVRGCPEPQ